MNKNAICAYASKVLIAALTYTFGCSKTCSLGPITSLIYIPGYWDTSLFLSAMVHEDGLLVFVVGIMNIGRLQAK